MFVWYRITDDFFVFFLPYMNPMEIKPKIYTHIYAISYRPQYKEISHKFVNPQTCDLQVCKRPASYNKHNVYFLPTTKWSCHQVERPLTIGKYYMQICGQISIT